MKKIIMTIMLAVAGLVSAGAVDGSDLLSRISDTLSGGKEMNHRFVEVRTGHPGKPGEETVRGELAFRPEGDFLSMVYDNGELFEIDGTRMTIRRDGATKVLDLSKNMMMKGLSHTLMYSFKGVLSRLAEEQKSTIGAEEAKGRITVTLTATRKQPKGLNKVEAVYSSKTCRLLSIRLDEFTGTSTYYYWE